MESAKYHAWFLKIRRFEIGGRRHEPAEDRDDRKRQHWQSVVLIERRRVNSPQRVVRNLEMGRVRDEPILESVESRHPSL